MDNSSILVHEATIDAAGAARLLQGEEVRRFSVQRVLGRLETDRLRGLDLVFVPHWYCRFRAVLEGPRAVLVAPAVWTMVEALTGNVLRLPGEPPLATRDLAALAPAMAVPPSLDRDVAVAKAHADLRWDLRARGRQRLAPRELELAEVQLAHVPFWLGYYAGRGGQLRARAVHGVEARIQDGRLTEEILRALDTLAPPPRPL
jgi:hypothetical protein